MAEEVESVWLMISIGLAFLAGLVSLFAFFWLRTVSRDAELKTKSGGVTGAERLEYYEKQLVDMRIRLDALEMMGVGKESDSSQGSVQQTAGIIMPPKLVEGLERLMLAQEHVSYGEPAKEDATKVATKEHDISQAPDTEKHDVISAEKEIKSTPKIVHSSYPNPIDQVLHLITTDITTSRDIQITMKKSREHTSRLLKKMYEDGYLYRSEDTRPYTYGITAKGKERLGDAADEGKNFAKPDS